MHNVAHYGYKQLPFPILKIHEEIFEVQNVSPDAGNSFL